MSSRGPQIAPFWLALLLALGIGLPINAQRGGGKQWQQREDRPRGNPRENRQNKPNKPPKQDWPPNRQPGNEAHVPQSNATRNGNSGTAFAGGHPNGTGTGNNVPPRWMERLRDMSPQQQERFFQNNQRFNSLSSQQQERVRGNLQHWNSLTPQQRMDMRDREQVWARMTPEQRAHIRNEVMPKWQQMLRVLQNMPESARNARLNEPNFTRGMSEEDKSTLKDLSHLHVGGAPD